MAFSDVPSVWFGPGYRLEHITGISVTTSAGADTITLADAAAPWLNNLDAVYFSAVSTSGLTVNHVYYLFNKTVAAGNVTFKLDTVRGASAAFNLTGSVTVTMCLLPRVSLTIDTSSIPLTFTAPSSLAWEVVLEELTTTEANATTGHFRDILYRFLRGFLKVWNETGDHPTRIRVDNEDSIGSEPDTMTRAFLFEADVDFTVDGITDEPS